MRESGEPFRGPHGRAGSSPTLGSRKASKIERAMKSHRAPWECSFGKEDVSTCRAGAAPRSDEEFFEIMALCILQSGLNWGAIRKAWPRIQRAFAGFDIDGLSRECLENILQNPDAIRNPKKIQALIANAMRFKAIRNECGSFANYLKALKLLSDRKAIQTLASGFYHLGEYSAEYFLHSVGYLRQLE